MYHQPRWWRSKGPFPTWYQKNLLLVVVMYKPIVFATAAPQLIIGHQVPDFQWHVIEDKVPFEIKDTGIKVTPFPG
jgi:hypothetical protein